MKKTVLIMLILLALTACATGSDGHFASPGGGSYEYQHTLPDGSICKVSVVSGRDVQGGQLKIDKDCAVSSGVDVTKGAEASLKVIGDTVNGLREAVSKIP